MKQALYKSEHRHATWLELFFDLIFVVAISRITHILTHIHDGHLTFEAWAKFFLLFIPMWWIWMGHTSYANRFDDDSRPYRFFTLLLMFLLILLSIEVKFEMEDNYRQFIILYSVARLFIAGFYFSVAFRFPEKRTYSKTIGSIYIIGALISCIGVFFSLPIAVGLLYAGLLFDLLTPFRKKIQLQNYPIDREHFVERIGLLGIILLGESIGALSSGGDDFNWTSKSIGIAVLGFALMCMIWWIYYDSFYFLKNSELDRNGKAISYSQVLTYMAFAILANMIRHAILADLALRDYRIMAILGMTLFYVGKQTSYWFNVPSHRGYNTRNALITIAIVALSLLLPNEVYIMIGVCFSMMVYIGLTYRSQIKMHGKVRM